MHRKRTPEQWTSEENACVRVLLECEPEAAPSIIASVIEREGYAVRTCTGPNAGRCDLLASGSCSLVDGADVVVNMLHTRGRGRRVLDRVMGLRRPPAVITEMTRPQLAAAGGQDGEAPPLDLDRVTVVETPVNGKALLEAIDAAADGRTGTAR